MTDSETYAQNGQGVFVPTIPVEHREDEYDSDAFDILNDMQSRHFWYLGRHRFILHCLKKCVSSYFGDSAGDLSAIDLGGGCGGWIRYLDEHYSATFKELALGDSSLRALTLAADEVGPNVKRYQVDVLRPLWSGRWDLVFLLDVLEHIPQDRDALREIWKILKPGGLLVVTTPALQSFWTYNDDLVQHVRRYSKADYSQLASDSGFQLCLSQYFMFLLSPLLLLSRLKAPRLDTMSEQAVSAHLRKSHRVPTRLVNQALRAIFYAETPLSDWVSLPWGTSIIAVLRKPLQSHVEQEYRRSA